MKARVLVCATLLLAAKPVFAQAVTGDAACGKVLDEAAAGCVEVVAAQSKQEELKSQEVLLSKRATDVTKSDAERQAAKTELELLQKQLAEVTKQLVAVTDTPFEKLDGFCLSVQASTPRTCDALATRLGAFDEKSLQPLAAAAGATEQATRAAMTTEAAASDRRTANNKSGSSAQLEPVESMQPITLAGGALSLSGSRAGSKGVGTISVNPLALAMPNDFAWGRLFDLSVSAPFDLSAEATNQDPYISARLRVNLTGPVNAAELQSSVEAWLKAAGIYADNLEKALASAKDTKACATYVAEHHSASASACEQALDAENVRKARLEAFAKISEARRKADQCYLGVDARFDSGDPTGPAVVGDSGKHGLGGFAAGIRIPQGARKLWDWELRARTAADLFKASKPEASSHSVVGSFDWGAAVIFSGRLKETAKQRLAFGVGAEGRHAFTESEAAKASPSNYVLLNLMAVVPALTGGDVGLALGIPLWELHEVRGVMATFSTDLGLLDHAL